MTTTQFLIVIGTVYIAPHIDKWMSICIGLVFLLCSTLVNLGVLPT